MAMIDPASATVEFTLDGQQVTVQDEGHSLLYTLREVLGVVGPKTAVLRRANVDVAP